MDNDCADAHQADRGGVCSGQQTALRGGRIRRGQSAKHCGVLSPRKR